MAQKTPFIDHYAALEIQPNASADEAKEAWQQLTRQLQPKANSGDSVATERLQEIHEAYTVLSDPRERIKYDREYEQHRPQLKEEQARRERYERERKKPEILKFEEEWLKLEQEEQSEKEQEETDRERHEYLKEIIIYLTIAVLIIAGVVGVGALIWFA